MIDYFDGCPGWEVGCPQLALAVDPAEPGLMTRSPRSERAGIFTRPVVTLMAAGGAWSTVINLGLFLWLLNSGRSLREAMGMVFVTLIRIELLKAYNFRSDRHSVFTRPFANRWLNLAVLCELALLTAIIYVPALQRALGTVPLSASDWLTVLALALTVTPVLESVKWAVRRGWLSTGRAGTRNGYVPGGTGQALRPRCAAQPRGAVVSLQPVARGQCSGRLPLWALAAGDPPP